MTLHIPTRLHSRKFWTMIFGLLYFFYNADYNQALGLLVAYIGVQGAVDYKHGMLMPLNTKNAVSQNTDSDPDTEKLVTGSGRIAPFDEQAPAKPVAL